MAFSRAKVQRFNDVINSVPSPTKYDPKTGDKVKGGFILKAEMKHVTLSDTASVASGKSVHTPIFRTPQVPKKHNCLGHLSNEKQSQSACKSIKFKIEDAADFELLTTDSEELNSLRIECMNKSETISDLEKHIQDLKAQVSDQESVKSKLESYIIELEASKANLECIKANNDNYEHQIRTFERLVEEKEKQIQELFLTKDEILVKMEESEKKNNKLEESNLDYERKIISLEGMIEQLEMEYKNKDAVIAELRKNEEMYKMNHTVQVECLTGKISTLENEIKDLEGNKRKNEASIFGLETQISQLRKEKGEVERTVDDLKYRLKEMEDACKKHDETITGLDMQLASNLNEIRALVRNNAQLKTEVQDLHEQIREEKESYEQKTASLVSSHESALSEVNKTANKKIKALISEIEIYRENLAELEGLLKDEKEAAGKKIQDLETSVKSKEESIRNLSTNVEELIEKIKNLEKEKSDIIQKHFEEVLKIENEYEVKLLNEMQENTKKVTMMQTLVDEKESELKQSNWKFVKILEDAKNNYEERIQETERSYSDLLNRLESDHLEEVQRLQEDNRLRVENLEVKWSQKIDLKNKEIDMLTVQYNEAIKEVNDLVKDVEMKDAEWKKSVTMSDNLQARIKLLLEEIKILNKENKDKIGQLQEMTGKYENESRKNEKLSEKLGELHCEINQINKDLNGRKSEIEKLTSELRKTKDAYDNLHNKKTDLEKTLSEMQDRVNELKLKMITVKSERDAEISKVNTELAEVKKQCRNFEIATGNTRKSLEALTEVLIETENQVTKLKSDNSELKDKLISVENDKNELETAYRELLKTKGELEAAVENFKKSNENLRKKYESLESVREEMERKIKDLSDVKIKLEEDKKAYDENLASLNELIIQQEMEFEKSTLEQVKSVGDMLMGNLESFMKVSAEEIQELKNELKAKTDDYDNLQTDNDILKTTFEITMKETESLKKHYEEQSVEFQKIQARLLELQEEKDSLQKDLSEKIEDYDRLKDESETLRSEISDKIILASELASEITNVKTDKSNLESQISELKSSNKSLETIVKDDKKRIQDLEKALSDVNNILYEKEMEIKSLLDEKLEYQQKSHKNTLELEELLLSLEAERKTNGILETLNKNNEKVMRDLTELKIKLESDANEYKSKCEALKETKSGLESQLSFVQSEMEKLVDQNEKLKEDVENLQKSNSERDNELQIKLTEVLDEKDRLEERKEYYKTNCRRLDNLVVELTDENNSLKKDFDTIHSFLQEKDAQVQELKKRKSELESLIGPFREQLEQYETERMFIENDREQLRKQHLEQAAKLGHQNHKQKIQHVVKLKTDLLESRKENEKLKMELKTLKKTVEKLREETGHHPKRLFIGGKRPSSTPFKGKENNTLLSPSAGLITPMSVKQEPMSPGSPLRDRNQ